MTETTTTTATVSSPIAAEALALLQALPCYQAAGPQTKGLLQQGMASCVADGLSPEEYCQGLSEWGGTLAEYLAENWSGVDGDGLLTNDGDPSRDLAQSVARFTALIDADMARDEEQALASIMADERVGTNVADQADEDTALEHEPAPAVACSASVDAARAQEALAKAKEQAEQEEQAARQSVVDAVKGMVKAYCRGERAYAKGLLEAGYYAHLAVQGKLRLGDKRKAAVQLVEGQLALHASDTVDANRLIRCWAAWHLLAEQPGLEDAAKAVPYGHYRDAWCKLVERTNPDTAQESYTLLPGLEAECLAAFKAAVEGQLGKDANHERCQALVREAQKREAVAKEQAAKQAKEAERLALAQAEKAKQDQMAKQAEERKAQEALAAAQEQAKEEASEEAAVGALTAAQEQAELARQAAEKARRERETADAAVQQKARDAARAKQEADAAAKREADALAKKAEQERKAREKEANKGTKPVPATQPSTESKAGQNLLASAKHGTVKDVAEMARELVVGGDEPDSVLEALLHALDGHKELSKASHRAIKAALVLLAKPAEKPAPVVPAAPAPVAPPVAPAPQATVKVPDTTAAA